MFELLASTLRLSTPLLFAAMGGLLCERSGIATICLEGVMLIAAWTAAVVTHGTHDPLWGLASGVLVGSLLMGVHALLSVGARADQIISGVAVNFLGAGIPPLLSNVLFKSTTSTPSIPMHERIQPLWGNLNILVIAALVLPFILHWALQQTKWGIWVTSSGEAPRALQTAGVSPRKVRVAALLIGGAIASLGGVFLSIAHGSQFSRDMTAGRGFIALTAVIFGKWRPLPTFWACLFFGLTDAMQIQLQSLEIFGHHFPVQFIAALPYLITLFVLVGFVGRSQAPATIGIRDSA